MAVGTAQNARHDCCQIHLAYLEETISIQSVFIINVILKKTFTVDLSNNHIVILS